MRFHNFLRSKQFLPPWLYPLKECLCYCFWLIFSPKFYLHRSAVAQTERQPYFLWWSSLYMYITTEAISNHGMCSISPWLLDSYLCCVQSSCYRFRLDPGKDGWKFSDALFHFDLKGFFLGSLPLLQSPRGQGYRLKLRLFHPQKKKEYEILFIS